MHVCGKMDTISQKNQKKIDTFFRKGGCDGTETERNYFTDMAKQVPDDGIILTAGCAKFRFNRLLEGKKVGAFPKVLDCGQCNDISGALAVASALAEVCWEKTAFYATQLDSRH